MKYILIRTRTNYQKLNSHNLRLASKRLPPQQNIWRNLMPIALGRTSPTKIQSRRKQQGHAMASWLATGIFIWVILFAPISGDMSAAALLEASIKNQYVAQQTANALP